MSHILNAALMMKIFFSKLIKGFLGQTHFLAQACTILQIFGKSKLVFELLKTALYV